MFNPLTSPSLGWQSYTGSSNVKWAALTGLWMPCFLRHMTSWRGRGLWNVETRLCPRSTIVNKHTCWNVSLVMGIEMSFVIAQLSWFISSFTIICVMDVSLWHLQSMGPVNQLQLGGTTLYVEPSRDPTQIIQFIKHWTVLYPIFCGVLRCSWRVLSGYSILRVERLTWL